MEGYTTRRCHLGVDYHSATISPSQALRERIFFQGRGLVRDLTSLTHYVVRIIFFYVIKDEMSK
jgi:hypothetical protein